MWTRMLFFNGGNQEGELTCLDLPDLKSPPEYMFFNGILYSRRVVMDQNVEYMRFTGIGFNVSICCN